MPETIGVLAGCAVGSSRRSAGPSSGCGRLPGVARSRSALPAEPLSFARYSTQLCPLQVDPHISMGSIVSREALAVQLPAAALIKANRRFACLAPEHLGTVVARGCRRGVQHGPAGTGAPGRRIGGHAAQPPSRSVRLPAARFREDQAGTDQTRPLERRQMNRVRQVIAGQRFLRGELRAQHGAAQFPALPAIDGQYGQSGHGRQPRRVAPRSWRPGLFRTARWPASGTEPTREWPPIQSYPSSAAALKTVCRSLTAVEKWQDLL